MQFNELFSRIIACNSISSVDPAIDQGNRPLVDLLANQLQDMGLSLIHI